MMRAGPGVPTADGSNADLRSGDLGPPTLTTRRVLAPTLAIGPIFSAAFLAGTVAGLAGFNTPLPRIGSAPERPLGEPDHVRDGSYVIVLVCLLVAAERCGRSVVRTR